MEQPPVPQLKLKHPTPETVERVKARAKLQAELSPLPDLKTLYAHLGRWPGHLEPQQAQGLYNYFQELEPCNIVEIGPYAGRALAFCGTLAKSLGHTYSILDDWPNIHPMSRAWINKAKLLYGLNPLEYSEPPDADVVIVSSGKLEQVKEWLGHYTEAEIIFLRRDMEQVLVSDLGLRGESVSGWTVYRKSILEMPIEPPV